MAKINRNYKSTNMKISTSLAIMFMLRWSIASFCQRLSQDEAYLGLIETAKLALKSNPQFSCSFHPAITNLCSPQPLLAINADESDEIFLGSGGFGRVFKIQSSSGTSKTREAVKEVNMAEIICKRIQSKIFNENLSIVFSAKCQKVITTYFQEFLENLKSGDQQDIIERLKKESSKIEVSKESSKIDVPQELPEKEISKESETLESQILLALSEVAKTKFDNVFDRFQSEVKIFKKYSANQQDKSQGPLISKIPLAANFHKCLVGPDLKMYIVTDVLGTSLASLLNACSNTLYHDNFEMQLSLVMEIVNSVSVMHENGNCHCDLKPGNYIYSDQFMTDLYVSDFGEAQEITKPCYRGTKGYFMIDSRLQDKEEIDFPQLAYSKRDVFSLGMILMEVIHGKTEAKEWRKLVGDVYDKNLIEDALSKYNKKVEDFQLKQRLILLESETQENFQSLNAKIKVELTLLILKMLNSNYKARPLAIEVLAEISNLFIQLPESNSILNELKSRAEKSKIRYTPFEKNDFNDKEKRKEKSKELFKFVSEVIEIARAQRKKAAENPRKLESQWENIIQFQSCFDLNDPRYLEAANQHQGDGSGRISSQNSFFKRLI